MPRRASSGINIGHVLAIGGAILGFLVAAVLLIRVILGDFIGGSATAASSRNFSSAQELPLSVAVENGNSLRGNIYRVSGKVDQSIRWTPDRGRLISFDATGTGGTNALVGVLIPEKFSNTNIDRGAEFTMIVRVDRGGLLVAEQIDES